MRILRFNLQQHHKVFFFINAPKININNTKTILFKIKKNAKHSSFKIKIIIKVWSGELTGDSGDVQFHSS